MKRKLWIFSIGAAMLLVLTCLPTSSLPTSVEKEENSVIESPNETTEDSDTVMYEVYHLKEDGTHEKTVKELTIEEEESLMAELKQASEIGTTLFEIFESKLQILKNYGIVSEDLTLEDIVDVDKLTEPAEVNQVDSFEAAVAPIVFVGGGFGFGFGIPFILTSGTFLMILFGFGLVLCYDFINSILHQLLTLFFIPMLIGTCSGFIGLLLLPVIPGFFYSNLVGIGMVALTKWRMVPSIY